MHLAMGDLSKCEDALERLEALRPQHLSAAYSFRQAAALRVRLLIRRGEFAAAADLAQTELAEFAPIDDTLSQVSLMTLNGLALTLSGRAPESTPTLLDASLLGASSFREQYAQYVHTCGLMLSHSGHSESKLLIGRSFRVWKKQENRCDALEAITASGSKAQNEAGAEQLLREFSALDRSSLLSPESRPMAINHLAAALDLAYSPKLLGEELVRVIVGCDLSQRAEVSTRPISEIEQGDRRVLALGEDAGKRYSLVCQIPDDPLKAILLGDVLRIGRAALALERAREEERNRAAL